MDIIWVTLSENVIKTNQMGALSIQSIIVNRVLEERENLIFINGVAIPVLFPTDYFEEKYSSDLKQI